MPFVIDAMRRDHLNCWILLDGKREILRQDDKDAELEASLDMLSNTVEHLQGDLLTITASKATGGKAAVRTFFVNMNAAHSGSMGRISPGATGAGDRDLYRELAAAQAQLAEMKMREHMQKEIDAMKQAIAGPDRTTEWIELAKSYAPHLGPKIGAALGAIIGATSHSTHLNGTPAEETITGDAMQVTMPAEAAMALQQLYEIDPDFSAVIVKFAKLAQDRAKYSMLKGML